MSPFGRRPQSGSQRSAEEREAARREREARRAAREGRPPPPPVAEDDAWGDVPAGFEDNGHVAHEPEWADAPVAEEPQWVEAPVADEPEWADAPVAEPESRFVEPPVDEAPAAPAPAAPAEEERPAWDDTGAWDSHPPAAETPAEPTPAPTLGEEMAAVDRGWFDDEEPVARDEPGGETAEWDVLAGAPKQKPQPPTGPGGIDSPTVEWDVLAQSPREAVPEARQQVDEPQTAPTASAAAPPPTPAPPAKQIPRTANGATRFEDDERPVPTRRVSRARTLPPPPPPPGEKKRRGPGRGTFAVLVLALLVAVALYLVNALFQPLADDGSGNVRVTIPQNSSTDEIAGVLEREGVVDSAFFFEVRTRLSGKDLQAGTFTLEQGMKYGDAITALSDTPAAPRTISITIPEGRARRETAPLVDEAGLSGSYLGASERSRGFSTRKYGAPRRLASLEGFLFPATYELEPSATSRDLVAKQVEAFEQNISEVSMRRARARNLSTYEVLIIASMIEREARLAKERRTISGVIHNRLREGMPLGIDATIRYATRNWSRPLRQSELDRDSPYNTRRRVGLPPGPIGSPGLASIKAAANPANVPYLYYVVKPNGDGAHAFSSTDAEFQRDVEAYRREQAARGGKDPSSSDGN